MFCNPASSGAALFLPGIPLALLTVGGCPHSTASLYSLELHSHAAENVALEVMMDQVCTVCRQQQESWSHLCRESREVVNVEMYRDFLQNSHPLDRLSNDDYLEIMLGGCGSSSPQEN